MQRAEDADIPRYWCLCNLCLVKNQGKPTVDIALLSKRTCQRHALKVAPHYSAATNLPSYILPGSIPYPQYDPKRPRDEDVRQSFLSWHTRCTRSEAFDLEVLLQMVNPSDYSTCAFPPRHATFFFPLPCLGRVEALAPEPLSQIDGPDLTSDLDGPESSTEPPGAVNVEDLMSRLPGRDGSKEKQGDQGRAYTAPKPGTVDMECLRTLLINILMLKARRPG